MPAAEQGFRCLLPTGLLWPTLLSRASGDCPCWASQACHGRRLPNRLRGQHTPSRLQCLLPTGLLWPTLLSRTSEDCPCWASQACLGRRLPVVSKSTSESCFKDSALTTHSRNHFTCPIAAWNFPAGLRFRAHDLLQLLGGWKVDRLIKGAIGYLKTLLGHVRKPCGDFQHEVLEY